MASPTKVLIIGATGKQGGAVIDALLSSPNASNITIFAATRNVDSPGAKRLASKSQNINLVKGQLEDAPALFKAIGGQHKITSVFCITVPSMKKSERELEEKQGKNLIDAAVANNVEHFVLSSVDRGGEGKSDTNPTQVPHFISKHNIEKYLREQSEKSGMSWTILRPTFFLDNLEEGFTGKIIMTCWAGMQKTKKVQLVAVKDIGIFAAKAIEDPKEFHNKAISLAGDEITFEEANKKYQKMYGKDVPRTFGFVGSAIKMMSEDMAQMFKWFDEEGYGSDLKQCREINPAMQDFEGYCKASHKP